ncbi:hypothetical protein SMICM17S_05382 [Streptomyces microflavus]
MSAPDISPAPGPLSPTASGPRMTRRQSLVLALLLGSQFMIAVDFSILNVALPVVGEGLGFSLAHLQWIATSFALAAAGFTLLFGRVADLVGRKNLFIGGMAVLGLSSALGGLATSPEVLLTARPGHRGGDPGRLPARGRGAAGGRGAPGRPAHPAGDPQQRDRSPPTSPRTPAWRTSPG